ncbi:gamma-aminobutyric acid receptor alpha-like [Diabrotica virgifera virgifera]|uniref:Gamma-aminobutyric acid receptor alpha-like isoform X1 n=1 Tax=Diabrotica virgifera virgifera TaxID=50390 RepID=A0A6P7FFA0_DIAVI|nr:gamma-aminobutyric acid receptor alpha-like [Diabrotica virgifera virgifera]
MLRMCLVFIIIVKLGSPTPDLEYFSMRPGLGLEKPTIEDFEEDFDLRSVIISYHPGRKYKSLNSSDTLARFCREVSDDAISKNISIILTNLLKNYESSELPTHGNNTPTKVETNILIRSMGPISELDMEYSMDCYFRQYWRDPRLSYEGPIKSLSLSIKMLERIWRPDTYFHNGKNSYVHTITVPNKLLRISQNGDVLYSMRLTIKAKCPMELRNFPMDRQSCPLIFGSFAYTTKDLVYTWQNDESVSFVPGMTLSQFDLISFHYRNVNISKREGAVSILEVAFNLQRHAGYFLIQVYLPCILIVVLSWVSFWIHREATSDRVGLGITTVLTLSTISLDSRTDLPKVSYATALDWFLFTSFFYCIATLLEFASVHYFTKVGSGEIAVDEEEWEDCSESEEEIIGEIEPEINSTHMDGSASQRNCIFCSTYRNLRNRDRGTCLLHSHPSTLERTTQTENKLPKWKQFIYCLTGDDQFRRQRQREAAALKGAQHGRHVNSVSLIDRISRIIFPASFGFFNLFYWIIYYTNYDNFKWGKSKLYAINQGYGD